MPVPERLVPIRAEQRQRKAAAVFAVTAVILYVLAALGVTLGALSSFDLSCLAGAALALNFVAPLVGGWRR
jgi:hypothetical protein